jgi:DNA-binding transcriptional regulator YhcF (GntR family)
MDSPLDVHSPTPIRQPVAESRMSVIAGEGLARGPSLPSIRELSDPSGATSGAVTRAIEDLKRSGYRPLHPDPTGPPRASIPGYRPSPASRD